MNTNKAKHLVFVCSGAADVGELTDRAARKLRADGLAAMSCLASVGARDEDIMFNTDLAERVLLIDGCSNACARRTFEHAGLHRFTHFDLSQAGLLKGDSPVSPENIQRVVQKAAEMLGVSQSGNTAHASPLSKTTA